MNALNKAILPLDKRTWKPSPLVGQVVLVTTSNEDGTSNVATKSWISMMAFDPPLLALGCNSQHWTARNILARRAFVVNVPGDNLADCAWRAAGLAHPRPVEALGLTSIPSLKVQPPRIAECRAHLECELVQHMAFGDEVILLGQILAISLDPQALEAGDAYAVLRPFVFLEDGRYGVIEQARQATGSP